MTHSTDLTQVTHPDGTYRLRYLIYQRPLYPLIRYADRPAELDDKLLRL